MKYNTIRDIDGHVTKRPPASHPNPEHWQYIQNKTREVLIDIYGFVQCGTCWRKEGDNYRFDCHHRHYNNWGEEQLSDVILLCKDCHKAITERIRTERLALHLETDDSSVHAQEKVERPEQHIRRKLTIIEETEYVPPERGFKKE